MDEFRDKILGAKASYLDYEDTAGESADQHLEQIVYTRFLDPNRRKEFFSAYKEIEALWEILSPSAELRNHIDTYKRLTHLYAVVRNAYANHPIFVAELARKTQQLMEESAAMYGLGNLTKTVTFDVHAINALRKEPGTDEAKVVNLVRGLRAEVESESELEAVLRPLKERAELVLKDLEERTTTGLAAMDLLDAIAKEKEIAVAAARDSTLTPRVFSVLYTLKDNPALESAGVGAMQFAQEVQVLVDRFPNAAVNVNERRLLRTLLYNPLLKVESSERSGIVDQTLDILLGGNADADT
jgi:type I restriction enzyme R subunit